MRPPRVDRLSRSDLASVTRRRPPAVCDYLEAGAYAQRISEGDGDAMQLEFGLAALRRFAESGAVSRAILESSPLLAPLRRAPEFAAILAAVR